MENLLLDYRTGLQSLRFSPIFSAVALLNLTIIIAVNVFVFSVGRVLLTGSMGIAQPEQVYQLRPSTWENWKLLTTSLPVLLDLRHRNHSFVDLAGVNGYSRGAMTWAGRGFQVQGEEVTGNYFSLLGVRMQLGTGFSLAARDAATIVLSDDLWRSRFGGDRQVVGKMAMLGRQSYRIAGVAPASFHGTERLLWPDYWTRMELPSALANTEQRAASSVTVLGRLRDDATSESAVTDLDTILRQLAGEHPGSDRAMACRLVTPGLFGDMRKVVQEVLLKAELFSGVVLLAGLVNLSCLLVARLAHRVREMGFRLALGSTFARLAQQLAVENAILCFVAGGLGTVLSLGFLAAVRTMASPFGVIHVPLHTTALWMSLLFTVTSFVLLTVPVLIYVCREKLRRCQPHSLGFAVSLQESTLRDVLLVGQIALCTLLAAASAVSVNRAVSLRSLHFGFVPAGAYTATSDADRNSEGRAGLQALLVSLSHVSGVTASGAVSRLPMTGGLQGSPAFHQDAKSHALADATSWPYVLSVSPGFFHAAGTALLSGRDVRWADNLSRPQVAVVNRALAHQLWGQNDVEGRIFQLEGKDTTVIGVVEDSKYHDLDEEHYPVAYRPFEQRPSDSFSLVLRANDSGNQTEKSLTNALHKTAPDDDFLVRDWSESLQVDLFPSEAEAFVLALTGAIAGVLSIIGVAGAIAYNFEIRTKELAIRIALGARRAHLLLVASGRPLCLLLAGIGVGCCIGLPAERVLAPDFHGASLSLPELLLLGAATILLCGLSASAYPVWKLTQLEPGLVVRQE